MGKKVLVLIWILTVSKLEKFAVAVVVADDVAGIVAAKYDVAQSVAVIAGMFVVVAEAVVSVAAVELFAVVVVIDAAALVMRPTEFVWEKRWQRGGFEAANEAFVVGPES